ncbi:DNA topoisomerase III, partial [bacterium]|nr:DNA topoisomerase III [bacterium]
SPACEYEEISLTGMIGNETFRAKGSQILKAGWREIYDADWEDFEDEEVPDNSGTTGSASPTAATWPDIREGNELPVISLSITEGKTKPPAYFTEGTLIAAMEKRPS